MPGNQHEGYHARLGAAVDPVVDRAALHDHVASLQVHLLTVEIHVNLARQDAGIVDRISAVVTRTVAGRELDDAKNRAVVVRGAGFALALVLGAVVIDGKSFAGPGDRSGHAVPCRGGWQRVVDCDDRLAVGVMAGNDASHFECHRGSSLWWKELKASPSSIEAAS